MTDLYHRRAVSLLNLKRNQEAYESLQTAIEIKPDDPYLRFSAAQVFERIGDQKRIIEEYTAELPASRKRTLRKHLPPHRKPNHARAKSTSSVYLSRIFVTVPFSAVLSSCRMGRNAEAVADLEMLCRRQVKSQARECAQDIGPLGGGRRPFERCGGIPESR